MHGYGTNLEGPFSLVSEAIEACHDAVHKLGIPRISTDIRIGTRIDKSKPLISEKTEDKVVESKETSDVKADEEKASTGKETEAQDWTKGLTENQRKQESVRRTLERENVAAKISDLDGMDLFAVA